MVIHEHFEHGDNVFHAATDITADRFDASAPDCVECAGEVAAVFAHPAGDGPGAAGELWIVQDGLDYPLRAIVVTSAEPPLGNADPGLGNQVAPSCWPTVRRQQQRRIANPSAEAALYYLRQRHRVQFSRQSRGLQRRGGVSPQPQPRRLRAR